MVDWKKKYFKMKINYINTKNKFNGGGPGMSTMAGMSVITPVVPPYHNWSNPESPFSLQTPKPPSNRSQEELDKQKVTAAIISLDKSGIPNHINSSIGNSLKNSLMCKQLKKNLNKWIIEIKDELEDSVEEGGQEKIYYYPVIDSDDGKVFFIDELNFNKELYFKVFNHKDYLLNLLKQLKRFNCCDEDCQIVYNFVQFCINLFEQCSTCSNGLSVSHITKKNNVVTGYCYLCREE